ncbi:MAG TPA: response regulator [Gemmatimonadales bacterium]
MSIPLRVLIAEDSEDDALLLVRELRRAGFDPAHERVENAETMNAALDRQTWDLVIGDYSMPHFSGTAALTLLRTRDPDLPFIFVSGTIGEDVAVEAMKAGAQDYISKSNLRRLAPAIERELRDAEARRERRRAQAALLERARLAELNSDVGLSLTNSGTLRETLQGCVTAFVRHLDVALARIWTLNDATNELELQASAGLSTQLDGAHSRIRVGDQVVGRIARDARPYLTNQVSGDAGMDDPAWAAREGMVAFAGFPLIMQERVLGVMAMFSRQPLSDFVQKALASVANGLAVGLERKRAEEALRRSEERFEKVFRASPVAITISTLDDARYLDVNDAYLRMLGYSRAEVIGRTAYDLGLWRDPTERERVVQQLRGGSAQDVETVIHTKEGRSRNVLIALERIDIGGTECLLGLLHDVTEPRLLEQQLRQAQKMEAVGRLAGGVAHDFNNLLTVITSYSDLLLEELPGDDPKRDDLVQIRKAAEGAAGLTRQLLAFSRQQVLQPRVLDLNGVVETTEKLLDRVIGEDIRLSTVLAADLGLVNGDPGQLEQILMNLVVNARDAMPHGGQLTIETADLQADESFVRNHPLAHPGRYAMLAVTDTGVGMDEETKAHIFEPFFTTKEQGKGTGLGLATVYGIVKQSKGFVWVYSEPGHGTCIKIYLPCAEVGASASEAQATARDSGMPRGSETVLVVEDAPAVRAVVRQVLTRQGYTVLDAPDGAEALRLAAEHTGSIHLLLTDLVMPVLGGRQLSERLSQLRPETKVLYTSGYTDDAVVRHGLLETGVAFLQKPFAPEVLARKVREVLNAPKSN